MNTDYPFEMRPLTEAEGGGWLITFPDLPGCMSDGETPEEALQNGRDAVECWIKASREADREIPLPGESDHLVTHIPKNLYSQLIFKAKQEGVSANTLVNTFIAECLAR